MSSLRIDQGLIVMVPHTSGTYSAVEIPKYLYHNPEGLEDIQTFKGIADAGIKEAVDRSLPPGTLTNHYRVSLRDWNLTPGKTAIVQQFKSYPTTFVSPAEVWKELQRLAARKRQLREEALKNFNSQK